jgi:hypothetical protein
LEGFLVTRREGGKKKKKNKLKKEIKIARYIYTRFFKNCVAKNIQG